MAIRGIIFDLDGTLVDTQDLVFSSYEHVLGMHNVSLSREEIAHISNSGADSVYAKVLPEQDTTELLKMHRDFQLANVDKKTRTYRGTQDMLEALRTDGYKIAVCTNRGGEGVAKSMERAAIATYVDTAVDATMVVYKKPEPEGVQMILAEWDMQPEEALFVGDSDVDIATARAAGLAGVIAVTHGFLTRRELERDNPDAVVDNAEEILQAVRRLAA